MNSFFTASFSKISKIYSREYLFAYLSIFLKGGKYVKEVRIDNGLKPVRIDGLWTEGGKFRGKFFRGIRNNSPGER